MKVQRAATHLKELNTFCARFKSDPYTISEKDDEERGLQIITIGLRQLANEVPILLGEIAHSLRSALDHLAWQLGLLSGQTPGRSSCFPIHSGDSIKDRERFIRATWDVPCEAVEIIKTFQPHLRGQAMKSYPLWQLNKLANLDKHVTIGYSHTTAQFKFVTFGVPEPAFTINEGTHEINCLVPIAHKGKVQIKPETPKLIFGKPIDVPGPDFTLAEEDIAEIHNFFIAQDVLPRFAPFFQNIPQDQSPVPATLQS